MSKRLQVLLEAKEYKTFQNVARNEGLSLGEWVRQSLRKAAQAFPSKSPEQKLKSVRKAIQHSSPTVDINQMIREIESGYIRS